MRVQGRSPGGGAGGLSRPLIKKNFIFFFDTIFILKNFQLFSTIFFSKSSETYAQNFGHVTIKDMQTPPPPSSQKCSNFKNFMKDVECAE